MQNPFGYFGFLQNLNMTTFFVIASKCVSICVAIQKCAKLVIARIALAIRGNPYKKTKRHRLPRSLCSLAMTGIFALLEVVCIIWDSRGETHPQTPSAREGA
ncbi:hypothetical protein [Helicobacter sp. MIT 01-3238]|uniref:hypothetical protein n=1 Tax=Helicobacter sp. MIT 01-3238 TaxID=398627 RepID=UPI0011C02178|nr:hypothetical protein [Helicobacter sp. MIT 01-3238]